MGEPAGRCGGSLSDGHRQREFLRPWFSVPLANARHNENRGGSTPAGLWSSFGVYGRVQARGGGQVATGIGRRTITGTRGAPGGCYGPIVTQTNHKRHLVSACFALGPCAGCLNRPARSLTKTRRRRRATGRFTKRGIRQARRPPLAQCVGIAHSPAATARRREDRAPFASLSDWFENQHRKARGCSQQTT